MDFYYQLLYLDMGICKNCGFKLELKLGKMGVARSSPDGICAECLSKANKEDRVGEMLDKLGSVEEKIPGKIEENFSDFKNSKQKRT